MMNLIKPERLCPGDTVGIVAPASPPPDPKAVDRAVAAIERLGFKPKPGKHLRARLGFIAGTDRERATDLMRMFTDKRVKAIICLRGGYGTPRMLNRLDYEVIRRNAKIFSGYSDITALHMAFAKKSGLLTFHAPMLNGELANPDLPDFARASFFRTVMHAAPAGSICDGYKDKTVTIVRRGIAEGRLLGGNLTLFCANVGTPFMPALKGRILFFEDVGEKPYRLDRMLTQLINADVFSQVAGVAVGVNKDCRDPDAKPGGEYRQSEAEVIKERLSGLGVPVVAGLPFGHLDLNATIPVGARARLDANRGDLIITEAAVS
jgi:muramoyltetrapeptide carboxypeptidase